MFLRSSWLATFRRRFAENLLRSGTAFIHAKTVGRTPLASCAQTASRTRNIGNIGMAKVTVNIYTQVAPLCKKMVDLSDFNPV